MILFILYITKQTCMPHMFYRPIYGTVPHPYNGTLSVCFLWMSWELWVGVNQNIVVKSLNQVNKLWVNREATGTAFSHFQQGPKVHFFPKSPFVNLKSKTMTPQYEILVAKLFFTWHRDWMVVAWREESLHITYPPYCFPP